MTESKVKVTVSQQRFIVIFLTIFWYFWHGSSFSTHKTDLNLHILGIIILGRNDKDFKSKHHILKFKKYGGVVVDGGGGEGKHRA